MNNYQLLLEIIGYVASVFVAISLMMSSIFKLRIINFCGAVLFSIYGFLINAYPVGLLNAFIALTNIYYLYKMSKVKDFFELLTVNPDSTYLEHFIVFYKSEIKTFVPEFNENIAGNCKCFFILRNMIPAGIFIIEPLTENKFAVKLDFVTRDYRDLKIANFLFIEKIDFFKQQGITYLLSHSGNNNHLKYLLKMGFKKITDDHSGLDYQLVIN